MVVMTKLMVYTSYLALTVDRRMWWIFSTPLRKRSHGHRHYTSPIFHDVSRNDLLPFMQKLLGMHHIQSQLCSLPLSKLHVLYNSCLVNNVTNPNSNEYKLTEIVLDIAGHRLFKPVGIKKDEIDKRSFLKLSLANKGLDGNTLGNILHHKTVKYKILPYLKDQSVPIVSYAYATAIASTIILNYKHVLHDLNIDDFKSMPPDCTCASSLFIYNSTVHVITNDLTIINNTCLRDMFAKGHNYRKPKSIYWKHNFKILMDSVPDNGQNVKRRT